MDLSRKVRLKYAPERNRARWKVQWAVPARAAGGIARASALSNEERKEIARRAAEARWAKQLPQATHEGVIRFKEIEIEVAILDDERRVITQNGLVIGLGRAQPTLRRRIRRNGGTLPAFLRARNLRLLDGKDLVTAEQIEFRTKQGVKAIGYAADLLPEVCNAFAQAQDARVLKETQSDIAERARIIANEIESLGIVRLIDEAADFDASKFPDAKVV